MKKLLSLVAVAVSLASINHASAQVTISDFSGSILSDSPWNWSAGNKTLSITAPNSNAGLIYPEFTFSAINIGSNNQLQLTLANTLTGGVNPGGGFQISLESTNGGGALANFLWSTFVTSTTGTATFTTTGGFQSNSVVNWNILDGGAGSTGGLTGAQLVSLQAVPEPSTYALMALGGLVLFFMVRRRKVQA